MSRNMRITLIAAVLVVLTAGAVWAFTASASESAPAADAPVMTVYKSPTCGCCSQWIDHVREGGVAAQVEEVEWEELDRLFSEHGVARQLQSCHLGMVDGYMVIGHVPADVIQRMLRERPEIAGITVPGMPIGSPGMEQGDRKDPYNVIAFTRSGETYVYESR